MVDKGIQIHNIFYMLAYAFRSLKKAYFSRVESEEFDDADDLLAEILYTGITYQIKQGLSRNYVDESEDLLKIRGKIDISKTISNIIKNKKEICCEFDIYNENIELNKILKTTIRKLCLCENVKKDKKVKLKKLLPYFEGVDEIELKSIKWEKIKINKNNQNYVLLINICKIISNSFIMSETAGKNKHIIFTDSQLNLVFQNFVFNYYKEYIKKQRMCNARINPSKIKRAIDETAFKEGTVFLPELQTDITIEYENKTLIIDTKYYEKILDMHHGKQSYHRDNINQIHEYVNQYAYNYKNKDVAGLLLYAKTGEDSNPNMTDVEMGHKFFIRSLDLNVKFDELKKQLDNIFKDTLINT